MEAPMPGIDQETQKIIATYQQIYSLIFKYGIFIILAIVSFVFILLLKPQSFASNSDIALLNGQFNTSPAFIQSGSIYIAKRITLDPTIATSPFTVRILQGFIDVSPEAQMGYGTLTDHSGLILPVSINLITHDYTYTREFFSGGYLPEDLSAFIKDTILTYPLKNTLANLYQYTQRPLTSSPLDPSITKAAIPLGISPTEDSLRDHFGLQCLSDITITTFFCYKNTQQFIARIPYIDFSKNLDELYSLMSDITETPYKKEFCDNVQYAFSKAVTTDRQRELIFSQCGENYLQAYHRISDFATVTYELQGISNANLYTDDDINIFKLVSMQQKIYQNTLQKNYDVGTIDAYLSFVQDLLNKRPNIDPIYKDITYLYNNTYLMSVLTQIAIINNNTKAMLRLADTIKNINGGSIHLERMVSNPDLVSYVDKSKSSTTTQQNLVTFQDLFANKFTTFENFIVTNQKVDNETLSAEVDGYFIVNNELGEKKVQFMGTYVFANDDFILTQASFPQNQYLEPALNQLIIQNTNTIDIPFVYEYIKNNISTDGEVKNLTLCDIIKLNISWSSCSTTSATFEKAGKSITFSFQGYSITSVSADNNTVAEKIRSTLGNTITTQENIGTIIKNLVNSLEPQKDNNTFTDVSTGIDTNQFTIIGKFKQFLGIVPDNINLNNGNYIVSFKFNDIPFIAGIDINNNYKLFPIGIQQKGSVTRINNFSLNFTNIGIGEINKFKADPRAYIKKADPSSYELVHPQP